VREVSTHSQQEAVRRRAEHKRGENSRYACCCRAAGSIRANARGLDALKLYRADYDAKLKALRAHPVHDWSSHAADAFRDLAMTRDGRAVTGFYGGSNMRGRGWFEFWS
jgi:hypothetical protein